MTRRRRGRSGAVALGARAAPILAAAAVGLGPGWFEAAGARAPAAPEVPAQPVVLETAAMAGTERYCAGYDTTFHGVWRAGDAAEAGEGVAGGPPVLFRIGVNDNGAACYAQLNVQTPPGVAPYELRRFRAEPREGGGWTLRNRAIVLEIDAGTGRVVRREGRNATRTGALLARPPAVGDPPPPPSARQRERWYGWWRGRFPGAPFPVALRLSDSGKEDRVQGHISMLLMVKNFTGRFHGEMLVFRWKNRHVGLLMEPDGDTVVYNDYKGRVSRFRRVS